MKKQFLLFVLFIYLGPSEISAAVEPNLEENVEQSLESPDIPKEVDISKHKVTDEEVKRIKKEAKETKKLWQKKGGKSMSLATVKRQLRAQKHIAAKNYQDAVDVLQRVLDRSSSEKYEKAKSLVLKAQALMGLKKYAQAEAALVEAMGLNILSYHEMCDALMSLAQNQLITKNYKDSKKNIIKYIEVAPSEVPHAFILLATIQFEMQEYKDAERNVLKAINMTKSAPESWRYFASAVLSKNKNYKQAEKILRKLLDKRQDNKGYWMSLIGVLFEQNKNTEALKFFEMANKMGYIDSVSEQKNRSSLLFQEKIPYKAAKVIEEAIAKDKIEADGQTYETLASFWFAAKELDRAIVSYQKASQLSDDGKVDLMLGQVYLEKEDWAGAKKSFQTALKKGKLKEKEGNAIVGLGMTAYFSDDKASALRYFSQAQKYKSQEEVATRWLGFLK